MSITWVSDYVSTVMDDHSVARTVAITRFAHGENHAVFRVSYVDQVGLDHEVVVRVSNSGSAADRAQAEREAAVLTRLAGSGSPRILDFRVVNPVTGTAVMCLEYVAGRAEPLDTASRGRMAELGAILRRVHTTPIDELASVLGSAPSPAAYIEDRLQSMLTRISLVRDPMAGSTQSAFHEAARLARRAALLLQDADEPGQPVLLHGDVSSGNILWTPHPVLIDWEYARIGDPADEIGYLFGQNALRQDQRDGLWDGYGHELDRAALERTANRAAAWEPVTLFGSALYWVDLWSRRVAADATQSANPSVPRDAGYYLDFAERYLDRCRRLWSDRGWKSPSR